MASLQSQAAGFPVSVVHPVIAPGDSPPRPPRQARGTMRFALLLVIAAAAVGVIATPRPTRAAIGGEEDAAAQSVLGGYLAGRLARSLNETDAAAAYFNRA